MDWALTGCEGCNYEGVHSVICECVYQLSSSILLCIFFSNLGYPCLPLESFQGCRDAEVAAAIKSRLQFENEPSRRNF